MVLCALLFLLPFFAKDFVVSWPMAILLLLGFATVSGIIVRCIDLPTGRGIRVPQDWTPHCYHCIEPISPIQHYCGKCRSCVGQFTPYLPFEKIPYYCQFVGKLIKKVRFGKNTSLPKRLAYLGLLLVLISPILMVILMALAGSSEPSEKNDSQK